MNLGQLQGWVQENKKQLAIAGAVGVGGLALMKRRQAGSGGGGGAATEDGPAGAGARYGLNPLPATGGGGVYDSSSSDVYNAIQPQLEDLGRKQSALEELLKKAQPAKPPTPVPAPPKTTTPKPAFAAGFYRIAGSRTTYRVDAQGNRDWLDRNEATAFGLSEKNNKGTKLLSADDPFWKRTKLLGVDRTPKGEARIK